MVVSVSAMGTWTTVASPALKPVDDLIARRMGEAIVLVHLPTNRIFELNVTGARIWELVRDGVEPALIPRHLVQEFEIDESRASEEVSALIERLQREGLIRL